MQPEYPIEKIEARRFKETSPVLVTFFYYPHKDTENVVENAYVNERISSEMVDHNTRNL